LSAFNLHLEALAAGAQGFSLENSQAPLAIAPRDVRSRCTRVQFGERSGTTCNSTKGCEGHIFPTGEAGKGSVLVLVLVVHAHQSMKERKKTTFSCFACSNTKKHTFCVLI